MVAFANVGYREVAPFLRALADFHDDGGGHCRRRRAGSTIGRNAAGNTRLLGGGMTLRLVTYTYVEQAAAAPTCKLRAATGDVADYLEAHAEAMVEKATNNATPPARFLNPAARQRFQRLASGTQNEFLSVAEELARRLQSEMDRRTKRGFFVALRRTVQNSASACVLKLDVSSKAAAALKQSQGQPDLAAVKDLLDVPGDLQKGAVTPDPRPASNVIVGERFADTSQYFLRALEIVQFYSERDSLAQVVAAVSQVAPDRVGAVIERIDRSQPMAAEDFFNANTGLLEPAQVADVAGRLAQLKRPLQPIDPSHVPVRRTIVADGIVIAGRPQELAEKLRI